jgi:hypothetical protein
MMGRREQGQGQFFCAFDLDKVVSPDHLVRRIDAELDLGGYIGSLHRITPILGSDTKHHQRSRNDRSRQPVPKLNTPSKRPHLRPPKASNGNRSQL